MSATYETQAPREITLRNFVHAWLFDQSNPNNLQREFDKWISILIIANLIGMLAEHIPAIYEPHKFLFHVFDQFSLAVFTVEYLLRLYVAPEDAEFGKSKMPRLRYIFGYSGISAAESRKNLSPAGLCAAAPDTYEWQAARAPG
ncbi:MAG: hypothetical protein EBV69_12975 [Oxalobacteraceae bacterium]|nr:hypothetical protein [Oxalobacteraceae bacterium]